MEIMAVQTAATTSSSIQISTSYLRAKRIFDIIFTLLVLPLILFVGLIIAICIKLDSKGPVLFRQKRVGQNGVEFYMLKFRSMYDGNNQSWHSERVKAMMKNSQVLTKDANDPRITRVGRVLRKLSLDELPQFWNVLRGEMTLVGPRPPLPFEVQEYQPRDWLRLLGKPGLTGLWQVYGRSRVNFQNMVDMDIDYLQKQSFWLDLKLIVLTVPVMITGRGGA
jgi:lipopolysaccharide/colanic/teichoic acid biosynthesis glycosyltransferase